MSMVGVTHACCDSVIHCIEYCMYKGCMQEVKCFDSNVWSLSEVVARYNSLSGGSDKVS